MSFVASALATVSVLLTVWSIVLAWPDWRFERITLEGFDGPRVEASPFRQGTPEVRPLYARRRDPLSVLLFMLHLFAGIGGALGLATLVWLGLAVSGHAFATATVVATVAGLLATVGAIPMWLNHRLLHGLLAAAVALFLFALWPPAVLMLIVVVGLQRSVMRRRTEADEHERRRVDAL